MRTYTCITCGASGEVTRRGGKMPSRCSGCAAEHDRAGKRARSARVRQAARAEPRPIICHDCRAPLGAFAGRGRPKERCAPCRVQRNKASQRARYEVEDKIARRVRNLARYYQTKYGLTVEERDSMLDLQNGRCAICGGGPNGRNNRLHVDHCHTSNRIRGLLCHNCNTMLGLVADDPARLRAAAEYLEKLT